MNRTTNITHAVVRCQRCGAPTRISRPFARAQCSYCGDVQMVPSVMAERLTRHFDQIDRYRQIGTESRHQREDHERALGSYTPSAGQSARWLLLNVPLIAGVIALTQLYPGSATAFIVFGIVGVSGIVRYHKYRRDAERLANERSEAGHDRLGIDVGWANCSHCGGQLPVCDEPPECPFCGAPLLLSGDAEPAIVESAHRHVAGRVEDALDAKRELDGAALRHRSKTVTSNSAMIGLYCGGIAGAVAYSTIASASAPIAVAYAAGACVAGCVGYIVFRFRRRRVMRVLLDWHENDRPRGRAAELADALSRQPGA